MKLCVSDRNAIVMISHGNREKRGPETSKQNRSKEQLQVADKMQLEQVKISKEQLINQFLMMEKKVKELEELVLKQQENVIIVEDVPIKIQIHQDEIKKLREENKRLRYENTKFKRASGK